MSRFAVDKSEPFTALLFFRKDSQMAGEALMSELKAKGRLTEKEMSEFSWKLQRGKLGGARITRDNFYGTVLRRFLGLGFVGKFPEYVASTRKTIQVYRAIIQGLPTRRPENPSFLYIAYETCAWWNELMFSRG